MTELPQAPVPPDCDCTDLDGFMLNVERLMASELVALSSHEVVGAALFLWCRAWKQRPAASLPDDDRVLASYAKLPLARFRKLRDEILRGFVKCSDGRLYHRVLAAEAVRSFGWKAAARKRREADAERLRKWRASQTETPPETPPETRFVAEGQDRTGHTKKEAPTTSPSSKDISSIQVSSFVVVATYTQAELETLQAEFRGIDVAAVVPELLAWAAGKGIHELEQKSAVYGALKLRQAKAELAERAAVPVGEIAVSEGLVERLKRRGA